MKSVEIHEQVIKGLQETQKYVKEKLICEEKETKIGKEQHIYKRVLYLSRINKIFSLDIRMILYEEKIKFNIIEIQDNLKNNPLSYETNFNYEDLSQKTVHFKSLGKIETIFKFLHDLFVNENDTINKENDKIIIKVKFPLRNKKEEVTFDIIEKDISLKTTLKNFSQSLKEINKDNIMTKADFKKNLLEKVYPIGSYYWTSNNISPSEIFGGIWTKIKGRFLFASDSNHNVGDTGGEEKHALTISEMPSHDHSYQKFCYDDKTYGSIPGSGLYFPYRTYKEGNGEKDKFLQIFWTSYRGSGNSHNNMPLYLTANCWKRTG